MSVVITFSGIDGAGKSTFAELACDILEANRRRTWLISAYNISISGLVGNLLSAINPSAAKSIVGESRKKSGKAKFLRKLKVAAFFADIVIFRVLLMPGAWLLGRALVCDRYLYDEVVKLLVEGCVSMETAETFWKLCPRPDLALFLYAPFDVSVNRASGEHDLKLLRPKEMIYLQLVLSVPMEAVDTTVGLKTAAGEVERVVLELIGANSQ